MPGPKDLDPSSSPRAMLGAELRHARERAGLSQEELGLRLFVSGSFVGQLEAAVRRMQPEIARLIDVALDTDDFFSRNCLAMAKSRYPEHFAAAAEAEAEATAIREYAPTLIPGLIQTPAYARAVNRGFAPTAPEETIDEWVDGRIARARLLDDPTKPMLWVVLDEAGLRRETGGRAVMAEALTHVADLARRNRVIVQVLPFSAGAHTAMGGSLKLMDFDDAPSLVYFEGPRVGRLEDDPALVAQLKLTFELLAASALPPEKSLAMVEALAQDYAHEEHL
ncbi:MULTISPECIES: helix-turn-helix domain-containing protein [Streptomyces]|uniref:Helix-turn-helix transcriptional regulator n=1 Tax=Streptomyces caniscabiei TaxID=2746961 RepID=A0ABU4MRN1_9ACTN|nr:MULTISPECIES: helix-turn-helix transcriptional regulator [Streptomyces]MBE4738186.1 helix-turn-helix domain-containing protein [Streptomyces caniscabiei]MBE4756948.1 helix-turn-helix domain-containing protein [Streptomyces caniscabiei]MBE4773888.1 helix-turn-helix domain-containing protein [Streptomyces caniscabiei]MBE4785542.1 helix-turn-helix domain-containing protein [Streptomyces caniscabiei]MBE4796884.1 helix-turn-helix domain-containing protein [Streptomyces caniscabiei]